MRRTLHRSTAGKLGALALLMAAFGGPLAGCADLLGGLEEGRAASYDAGDAGLPEGAPDVKPAAPWLEGFAYRVAFEIDSKEASPLVGFTTRLGLATRGLVAAKKMRADGADLRVTQGDATTVAPHWIQSGLGGDATTLWAKLDLAPGPNTVFVYYGSDAAISTSDVRKTFIDGVIANPSFDNGTAPWSAVPSTSGGASTLTLHDGRASVMLTRDPSPVDASVAWCQVVELPPGRVFRLVFDATTLRINVGQISVWSGQPGGTIVWSHPMGVGRQIGVDSDRIEPGSTQVCFGASVRAYTMPQAVAAEFQNVRVRLFAEHDPVAGPAGREEQR
jgi:hypothetical protein